MPARPVAPSRAFATLAPAGVLLLAACGDNNITTSGNPPNVLIASPPDGWVQSVYEPLELRGRATDSSTPAPELLLQWSSTLSGVLYEGPPDDIDGNIIEIVGEPEPGAQTIRLLATDENNESGEDSIQITVVADQVPSCAITAPEDDAVIDANTDLVLQGQVGDAETPLPELLITWESDVDGVLDEAPASDLGVVSATVVLSPRDHVITLTVVDSSGLVCVDSVDVVANGRPTKPEVQLLPDPPDVTQDLVAWITTPSVDPEGTDIVYQYRWELNGSPQTALTTDTVPATALARDQVWDIVVYAIDDAGMISEPGVDTAIVPNTAPSAPGVEIDPATPSVAQDLLCSIVTASADPDAGDVVSYGYAWERDGVPAGPASALLPWTETAAGEVWTCVVTPNDGSEDGEPGEASVTIEAGCSALQGDGVAGQAIILDDPALRLSSGPYTVEAWFRADSLPASGGDRVLVAKRGSGSGNGWYLGMTSAGALRFQVSIGGNPKLEAGSVAPGAWHHVAATYEPGSGLGTLWLDGEALVTGSLPQPNSATATDLWIGNDPAGLVGRAWDGLVDDVRISSNARYSLDFVPDTSIGADADTVAWWGFEEGGGSTVHDLSGAGYDGFMAGASFSSESSCDLDLPPSQPVLAVTPPYPELGDDLECALSIGSADPEGVPVTYSGEWWVDGVPSGNTFGSFPATLSGSLTAEGEQWTCRATASDGAYDSEPGEDSVWVGAMPVCTLEVTDAAAAATESCSLTPPVPGRLRFSLENPDGSADGAFTADLGIYGTTWIFTGFRDWAYAGDVEEGWTAVDVEMNATPGMGALTFPVDYEPGDGTDNTGPDTLTVAFVYGGLLDTAGATLLGSNAVAAGDATNGSPAATTFSATIGSGERLLVEADACGFGGGGHGVYASDDAVTGNDGLLRVDTGWLESCAWPLRSISLDAGTWTFSLVHEDDNFVDNSGARGVSLYRYAP
jgi:hypothetical protein